MSIAICSVCEELAEVWCDDGYIENPDGTVEHDNPVCRACCERERRENAKADAWDAYVSGRPMSSDDY